MAVSVRNLIRNMQREIRDGSDLSMDRAAELLTKLTALLGNVNDEIRQADADYAGVLLQHLETEEAVNRAKVRAELSPEYQRKREARDLKELTVELIRGLKFYLRSKQDELRLV
jgi:hypothetical protein